MTGLLDHRNRDGDAGPAAVWSAHRPELFRLAYRLLGSVADAEDVLQECYLRLAASDLDSLINPVAWLTRVTSRLCLDRLAARRREPYPGPRLPDPVLDEPGPEDRSLQAESVTVAFLVVLETLSPPQRVAFILHDVFSFDYPAIAEMLGKSQEATRRLVSRARQRVRKGAPELAAGGLDDTGQNQAAAAFLEATRTGDLTELVRTLAPDAELWTDGGGRIRAARKPVRGRQRVARFLVSVGHRPSSRLRIEPATVNGAPGAIIREDGRLLGVMALTMAGGLVAKIHIVVIPTSWVTCGRGAWVCRHAPAIPSRAQDQAVDRCGPGPQAPACNRQPREPPPKARPGRRTAMPETWRLAAFTQDPAGGNPAGVVLTHEELAFCEMQRIAADVGYAETAFLVPRGRASYRVRYFSPVTEVAFCGHATIAAAVGLATRKPDVAQMTFLTNAGPVPVDVHRGPGGTSASLTSPATRNRPVLAPVLEEALDCFGWDDSVLDRAMPPAEAYGGALHLLLPLRSREDLRAMRYDFDRLRELMWNRNWTTVDLVWRKSPDTYHARNAFPIGGVEEDPATGAAAAALGGYLRDHRLIDGAGVLTIHQGEDMGRPSTILVEASAGQRSVRVRGSAVPIAATAAGRSLGRIPERGVPVTACLT